MLQLSTAAIFEKNKLAQDTVWIVLLELQAGDGTVIRIAANTEDAIWNGETWTAFPFTIDSVTQSKTELPQVPVKVSNVTRTIEQYIEQYAGFIGNTTIIRVVNSGSSFRDTNGVLNFTGPAEVEETFCVQSTTSDNTWATFTLGGALPLMMRFPFRRILKDWCPFQYKGIECGATSDLPTCTYTIQGCRDRNNSTRFGGEYSMSLGGQYVSNS